ncbi:MAG: hypothetical protein GWP06_02215 [Actinobacteria bacterium]|nr:hypothetical protein [Actinomycetota bacterium]
MSKIGTFVLLKLAAGLLVGQNALSFKSTTTMIETSSKTTGNESEFVAGRSNKTMTVAGIAGTALESTDKGYWELFAAQEARTAVAVTFAEYTDETGTTPQTGSELITASALISNLSSDWGDNASNSFSCDLQITGAVTETTSV